MAGRTQFHWERAGNGREGGDGWEGVGGGLIGGGLSVVHSQY